MVCASPAPIFLFWAFGICLAALKLRRGVVFRWRNLSRKCRKIWMVGKSQYVNAPARNRVATTERWILSRGFAVWASEQTGLDDYLHPHIPSTRCETLSVDFGSSWQWNFGFEDCDKRRSALTVRHSHARSTMLEAAAKVSDTSFVERNLKLCRELLTVRQVITGIAV